MNPDHPVEQVSWEIAQSFVSRINALSEEGNPLLQQVIVDHKPGDQYRLPTEEEWEFVVRNRGHSNGKFHFGDDVADIDDYDWTAGYEYDWQGDKLFHEGAAGGFTQQVALLKPLVVDGKEFFDMHGNVLQWMQKRFPHGKSDYIDYAILRGGSFDHLAVYNQSSHRSKARISDAGSNYKNYGVRLVRIIK